MLIFAVIEKATYPDNGGLGVCVGSTGVKNIVANAAVVEATGTRIVVF